MVLLVTVLKHNGYPLHYIIEDLKSDFFFFFYLVSSNFSLAYIYMFIGAKYNMYIYVCVRSASLNKAFEYLYHTVKFLIVILENISSNITLLNLYFTLVYKLSCFNTT